MWHPAHIDGRTLVILRDRSTRFRSQWEVAAAGWLEFDGETLTLSDEHSGIERVVQELELEQFQPVSERNRIPCCQGFDFFLIDKGTC